MKIDYDKWEDYLLRLGGVLGALWLIILVPVGVILIILAVIKEMPK